MNLVLAPSAFFLIIITKPFLIVLGGNQFNCDMMLAVLLLSGLFLESVEQRDSLHPAVLRRGSVQQQSVWESPPES